MEKQFREYIVKKLNKKFSVDVANQQILDIRKNDISHPAEIEHFIRDGFGIDEDYIYMITIVWLTENGLKNPRNHFFIFTGSNLGISHTFIDTTPNNRFTLYDSGLNNTRLTSTSTIDNDLVISGSTCINSITDTIYGDYIGTDSAVYVGSDEPTYTIR